MRLRVGRAVPHKYIIAFVAKGRALFFHTPGSSHPVSKHPHYEPRGFPLGPQAQTIFAKKIVGASHPREVGDDGQGRSSNKF
jgi:hypothetical protein